MGAFAWIPKLWGGVKSILDTFAGPAAEAGAAYLGYKGQQETNAANAAQAQKQMDFQERMRATQYQTTVADLTKAGLNPALAYSQGGAGTPGGAAATMGNPVSSGVSSAAAALSMRQQLAATKLTEAQATDTLASAGLKEQERTARSLSEGGGPIANYYQAAQIARWKADALGLKLTEAQFNGLVQQVYAQLKHTTASARQTQLQGDILAPEAAYRQRLTRNQKGYDFMRGMKDVLDVGSSAASIATKVKF